MEEHSTTQSGEGQQVELVPLANAAMRLGMTREQVLRRVQTGVIQGAQVEGYWYVHADSLAEACKVLVAEQRRAAIRSAF